MDFTVNGATLQKAVVSAYTADFAVVENDDFVGVAD